MAFLLIVVAGGLFASCSRSSMDDFDKRENLFNHDWEFVKEPGAKNVEKMLQKDGPIEWEQVSLPHTANIEPLVIRDQQWQGTCYYRKFFTPPREFEEKYVALRFEGAMHEADVFLNGDKIKTNQGGYLPFFVDINEQLKYGEENVLLVKLNNENNPEIPPGKPIENLDFNWYSGLYRNVWLLVKDNLHISDAIGADRVAGGGIMVRYSEVKDSSANVHVQTDVNNYRAHQTDASVQLELISPNGEKVAIGNSDKQSLGGGENGLFDLTLKVKNPRLWSPDYPHLYDLKVTVSDDQGVTDRMTEKIGIRTFEWTPEGFTLNGEPLFLRGTNRHQEYPYIGYALSDNANYRDAFKIKQAGFNFVRLAHYPHSPSFMEACDELGLLTMDAIPGWQFFGDETFQENAISDVRKMVRRDRNHPSVAIWEASLNESEMSTEFIQKAHNAVLKEYPAEDVYTCGWMDEGYDVFIPARQHGEPPHYWNKYNKEKPYFIAEYGDWEYYAQNAGFNQDAFEDLSEEERNSRQLRGDGQKRLAQQALNYQEAHNSNLKGKAAGDANWLMFDYNRGYASNIEASGIMDIFRLPKFAYYFYRSQADIKPEVDKTFFDPFVEIANFYHDPSFNEIKVYSNCDEVELLINGESIGRQRPDEDQNSTHLSHPPFTFHPGNFESSKVVAKGIIDGEEVTRAIRQSPGEAASLKVWIDESGRPLEKGKKDVVFLHTAIVDENGTTMPENTSSVHFEVEGDATLIGQNPVEAEAGIATILLRTGDMGGGLNVTATVDGLGPQSMMINVK